MSKHLTEIIVLNHVTREREGRVVKKIVERSTDIPCRINLGTQYNGPWWDFRDVMLANENGWRLVIHDDLIFPFDAFRIVDNILSQAPQTPICFYNPDNRQYAKAWGDGYNVMKTNTQFWLQATAYPSGWGEGIVSWADINTPDEYRSEDMRVVEYLNNTGRSLHAIMPSLFQHIGKDRSTLGHGGNAGKVLRRSANYEPDFNYDSIRWDKAFEMPIVNNSGWRDKKLIKAQEENKKRWQEAQKAIG